MAPNNEQRYNTHEYAGDEATRTHRTMQHMPDEDRTTRADLQQYYNQSMATELSPEVRMGDDRAIGDTPNWEAYSSEQLYNFAREGNSPTTADSLGRGFNTGGNNLATAANGLFEAVTMLDGAWSGVAADSARDALAPLAKAAGHAGQTAQLMGVRMSEQSVAASEVMKLPPPQEFNTQQALGALMTGGIGALQKDMKAQKDAADKVKKEQITYLTGYTNSMSAVDSQTPTFLPPPKGITGGDGGGTKITGGDVLSPTAGRQDLSLGGGTSTGGPSGGWTGAQPGGDQGFNDPNNEGGNDNDLPPIGVGTGSGTGASGFTGTAPGTAPPTTPGLGGGPHAPAPSAGAGGFGPGFGSFGGGGAGGAGGAGGGAGGAGGAGAGQGSGAGRGPAGPMPGRGMGPGGRGMGPGGMGAGGKRADGEEDEEHNRPSYLVEGDPEGTFGNDQMTAPSVIGDDNN